MTVPHYREDLPTEPARDLEQVRTMVLVVYACYAVGVVTGGLPTLVGVIIAYLKRSEAIGTVYASHFEYQINTFWYMLLITIIGIVAMLIFVGWIVLGVGAVWYIYRIVKGGLKALDRQPI